MRHHHQTLEMQLDGEYSTLCCGLFGCGVREFYVYLVLGGISTCFTFLSVVRTPNLFLFCFFLSSNQLSDLKQSHGAPKYCLTATARR